MWKENILYYDFSLAWIENLLNYRFSLAWVENLLNSRLNLETEEFNSINIKPLKDLNFDCRFFQIQSKTQIVKNFKLFFKREFLIYELLS